MIFYSEYLYRNIYHIEIYADMEKLEETKVPGLLLVKDALTEGKEIELVNYIDNNETWERLGEKARRVQYHGFRYEYLYGNIEDRNMTKIPDPLLDILKVCKVPLDVFNPSGCLVNEYMIHQGIQPHIDKEGFGKVIVGISLLEDINMIWTRGSQKVEIFVPRRSLYVMSGESRRLWKHSIPKRKTVTNEAGIRVKKKEGYRRISLTYRQLEE